MSKQIAKLLALLIFLSWRTVLVQAQTSWFKAEVEDYKTHQPLSATWRWTDSTRKTVIERTTRSDGFAGQLSSDIRFLTVISPGYRSVQLPIHWLAVQTDSLSFRVRIPLVPIDKPTTNQPYFQSEQRPLQVARSHTDSAYVLVTFSVVNALTDQPVNANLCLFFTKQHTQRCSMASTLQTNLLQNDIVAFEARAAGYQPYLGNLVITDSTILCTVRLNPTPTILLVSSPEVLTGLQLKKARTFTIHRLTTIDSSHFFSSTEPGIYQLTGSTKNRSIRDTIQLIEGLNAYAIPNVRISINPNRETTIYFAQSRYELTDSSRVQLNQIAVQMRKNPSNKLRITGHTDNVGRPELNRTLAEFRAKTAKNYLINQGIQESRLLLIAAGADQPVVSNDTEENRKKNRRVSLYVQ